MQKEALYRNCKRAQTKEELFEALGFSCKSITKVFLERCNMTPNKVALRAKEFGIYRSITWGEYLDHVENIALGLIELGLEKSVSGPI